MDYEISDRITEEIHHTSDDFRKIALYITKLTLNYYVSQHIIHFFHDLLKYTDVKFDDIIEILNGAYVVIKDDKQHFYNKYKKYNYMMVDQGFGGSSHYSHVRQARIGNGTLVDPLNDIENDAFDLLIGSIDNSRLPKEGIQRNKIYGYSTWFQFEAGRGDLPSSSNPISWYTGKPTIHSARHWESSIKYFGNKSKQYILNKTPWSGGDVKNVGALGESIYNDSNPLVLNLCKHPKKINHKIVKLMSCEKYNKYLRKKT
jgi:hypothetical protein